MKRSQELRSARIKAGLSQRKAAYLSNYATPQIISAAENGRYNIPEGRFLEMMRIFKLPQDELDLMFRVLMDKKREEGLKRLNSLKAQWRERINARWQERINANS